MHIAPPHGAIVDRGSDEPRMSAAARSKSEVIDVTDAARADHFPRAGERTHGSESVEIRPGMRANVIERHYDHPRRPESTFGMHGTERAPAAIVEREDRLQAARRGLSDRADVEQRLG